MDHLTVVKVNKHIRYTISTSFVPNSYKQYCCRSENILLSITIFFADFCVVIFIIIMSNLRSFAGKTGETQIDDGFYRAMLCIRGTSRRPVSVSVRVRVRHNPEFY